MSDDVAHVARVLGPRVELDRPLGPLTTYRVGGPAALFFEARSEGDLLAVRKAVAGTSIPLLVVGNGSNMLVADAGFDGLAIRLGKELSAIDILRTNAPAGAEGPGGSCTVRAGGAAGLPIVARRSVEAGVAGLEWAVGVPGSVGGAVRMNAGGHGADIASCLIRCRWFDLAADREGEAAPEDLAFGYRTSSISSSEVVVWAELSGTEGTANTSRRVLSEIVRWRRQHQPGGSNAGSVFTNPPGDSAGRLVEAAGLKGLRMGTAAVSPKHANFIQADDEGSADDVRRLIEHVAETVAARLGVTLSTEVHLIGFAGRENGRDADRDQSS